MAETLYSFTPTWILAPGEVIADLIEEEGWSQADLARRLGYTLNDISLLIEGKALITEETALKLENVFGSNASFWLRTEAQYRADLAQQRAKVDCQQRVLGHELPVKQSLKNSETRFASLQHRFNRPIAKGKKGTYLVRKHTKYGIVLRILSTSRIYTFLRR